MRLVVAMTVRPSPGLHRPAALPITRNPQSSSCHTQPYASLDEPREDWRSLFYDKFSPLVKGTDSLLEAAREINYRIWDLDGWNITFKAEQTPEIMSPSQVGVRCRDRGVWLAHAWVVHVCTVRGARASTLDATGSDAECTAQLRRCPRGLSCVVRVPTRDMAAVHASRGVVPHTGAQPRLRLLHRTVHLQRERTARRGHSRPSGRCVVLCCCACGCCLRGAAGGSKRPHH